MKNPNVLWLLPMHSNRTDWNNLLLGCKYCNTRKGKKTSLEDVDEYIWPDRDNTALAYKMCIRDRPYILHKTGKQEHEPKKFTVYHGTFKHQYHHELVCSCVHRYRKIRGSASNRIKVFTTILTTFDRENIGR